MNEWILGFEMVVTEASPLQCDARELCYIFCLWVFNAKSSVNLIYVNRVRDEQAVCAFEPPESTTTMLILCV